MSLKLKELTGKLGTALSGDLADANTLQTAQGLLVELGKLADAGGSEDAGLAKTLKGELEQLRKDVDKQALSLRDYQRSGLSVRSGSVVIGGREERMDRLAVGVAFATDEMAKRFAAHTIRVMCDAKGIPLESLCGDAAKCVKELSDDVCKANEMDTTSASAIIPNEFRAELIRNVETVGVVYTKMRRVPLGAGSTIYPRRTSGLTAYPLAVLAQFVNSRVGLDTVTLTPVKWGTLTPIAGELFRAPQLLAQLGQFLGTEIVFALGDALDNAVINGDGTGTYGGIMGILNDTNITAVTTAAHTTAATLDSGDVIAVPSGIPTAYGLQKAEWYMHNTVRGVVRAMRDTVGRPIFEGLRVGNGPLDIDGYPLTICQRMTAKASATAGQYWAFFGDLALSHLFGMIGEIRIDTSDQVFFASDQVAIRGIIQVDCKLMDANAVVTAKLHA